LKSFVQQWLADRAERVRPLEESLARIDQDLDRWPTLEGRPVSTLPRQHPGREGR
jgi:hypothetical protein